MKKKRSQGSSSFVVFRNAYLSKKNNNPIEASRQWSLLKHRLKVMGHTDFEVVSRGDGRLDVIAPDLKGVAVVASPVIDRSGLRVGRIKRARRAPSGRRDGAFSSALLFKKIYNDKRSAMGLKRDPIEAGQVWKALRTEVARQGFDERTITLSPSMRGAILVYVRKPSGGLKKVASVKVSK